MNWLKSAINDSAKIFLAEPKLILPKLLISFAYGFLMLYSAEIISNFDFFDLQSVFFDLLSLLLFSFFVLLFDIIFSSMYSFLIKDYFAKKKLSLLSAFVESLKKSFLVVPLVLLIMLGYLLVNSFFSFILIYFFGYNYLTFVLDFVLVFVFIFSFYFIFPVSLLEKRSVLDSIRNSLKLSFSNWQKVSVVSLVTIFLSSLSFVLAFLIDSYSKSDSFIVFAFIFVLLRFFVAYLNTYIYILNPVFYFKGRLK